MATTLHGTDDLTGATFRHRKYGATFTVIEGTGAVIVVHFPIADIKVCIPRARVLRACDRV